MLKQLILMQKLEEEDLSNLERVRELAESIKLDKIYFII